MPGMAAAVRPGLPGAGAGPGGSGSGGAAPAGAPRPGDPPRVDPPEASEWMLCTGKDGAPGWFAVPRATAARMRAAAKRRADGDAAGAPPAKAAASTGPAGGRRRVDDDLTAGGAVQVLDVLGMDELQEQLAHDEAAKGAVVAEAGHVQASSVLPPTHMPCDALSPVVP